MRLLVYETVREDPKGLVDELMWWLLDGPNFLTDERIACVVRKGAGWLVEKVVVFFTGGKEEEVVLFPVVAKEEEVVFFLIGAKEEKVMFFPAWAKEEVICLCMTKEVTRCVEDGDGKTVGSTCTLVDELTYMLWLKDNLDLSTDDCMNWLAREELGRLVEKTMCDCLTVTDWLLCKLFWIISFLVNEVDDAPTNDWPGWKEDDAALPNWVDWFFDLVLSLLFGITYTLSDEVEDVYAGVERSFLVDMMGGVPKSVDGLEECCRGTVTAIPKWNEINKIWIAVTSIPY